jgi:hypothetical protein
MVRTVACSTDAVRALRETEQLIDRGIGVQHGTSILGGHPPSPMACSIRVGDDRVQE